MKRELKPDYTEQPGDNNFDYRDERLWITRELALELRVEELTEERDFLRAMLRAAFEASEEE